ncbi:NAD-dependent epimerase/dehydratase family protein, partial [Alcanivorax sp.]|uniref:NAD-dependent epimerase/dehydratase family protein n=1 Tax=Alcanivorax sp. TaxID=1872427 RepID=UPI0025875B5D
MSRVAVTGAAGFIGSSLFERFRIEGADMLAIVHRPILLQGEGIHWDMLAEGRLEKELRMGLRGTEVCMHLAGKAHALSERAEDEAEYFTVNTEGTRRLLEAARDAGVRRFVFFSSVKAADADTPYARSKREAERLVLEGGYVPEPVVIRPAMVYGPTTKGNLPRMIRAVARGWFPPVPDAGRRAMVHVDDVVEAAWLAATRPEAVGKTYVVADGEAYTTRRIHAWICEALGRPAPRFSVPLPALRGMARIGDAIGRIRGRRFMFDSDVLDKLVGDEWYDGAMIRRELGFAPARNLRDALPGIIEY